MRPSTRFETLTINRFRVGKLRNSGMGICAANILTGGLQRLALATKRKASSTVLRTAFDPSAFDSTFAN